MLSASLFLSLLIAAEPKEIPIWGEKIPGPTSKDPKNVPTLTIRLADKPNGTAVVVCPGGGYSGRAIDHEGKQIADWLNARGVHAFILKYRTVNEGKVEPPLAPGPIDMTPREVLALAPLVVLMLWIGLYPKFFLDHLAPAVNPIARQVNEHVYAQHGPPLLHEAVEPVVPTAEREARP